MKIIHLCLGNYFVDGYGYQENIITKMHKRQGHEVLIVASTETIVDNFNLGYVESRSYINEDGIPIHRIPYINFFSNILTHKLRLYKGLYKELELFTPDIIFMHNFHFLGVKDVVKYIKRNKGVKLYVDSHVDPGNSIRNKISKYVLHSLLYKCAAKMVTPYASKFYGTLPCRTTLLSDFYGIPKDKTAFLPMGADDELVLKAKESEQRKLIRHKYEIKDDELLIVSGGRFDRTKTEIIDLMKVILELSKKYKLRMLIFGALEKGDFKIAFDELCDNHVIRHIGWIKGNESYNFFEAADLVIFAGSHSVLWEQAVGQGKPCIFKYMEGFTHVDLGGNCSFFKEKSQAEYIRVIEEFIQNYSHYAEVAKEKGLIYFSYQQIAKKAIGL